MKFKYMEWTGSTPPVKEHASYFHNSQPSNPVNADKLTNKHI